MHARVFSLATRCLANHGGAYGTPDNWLWRPCQCSDWPYLLGCPAVAPGQSLLRSEFNRQSSQGLSIQQSVQHLHNCCEVFCKDTQIWPIKKEEVHNKWQKHKWVHCSGYSGCIPAYKDMLIHKQECIKLFIVLDTKILKATKAKVTIQLSSNTEYRAFIFCIPANI